tara:strand:+ start:2908 stop:3336 length:429 start_codon:yes stop_codon:yes gene_type:complete
MKHCNGCKEDKKTDEFHKRKASSDGLAAKCKSCQVLYDKARANDPKRVLARLEYSKTEAGIIAASRAKKKYIENNPIKRNAHVITGNAIRGKKLFKEPCEVCNKEKAHAHHDDYAKPLNVRWLCNEHHNKWHRENGEGLNAR